MHFFRAKFFFRDKNLRLFSLINFFTDVIEAGIRFYDKILNKNVALRELSGKDLYSVKGNEYPGLLRYNMFPLTTRKLFFQQKLEELHKNEAAEKNNTAKETTSNQQPQNKPE